ncbi:MAG: ABC transporter permease subunit [Senegalia sp. (in: firmicutes)]
MNIFKHEFKMKRKSILIWSISLAAFMIFYMAFFPGLVSDAEGFNELMQSLPDEFLQAFGMQQGLSFTTLIGYFALTFSMIELAIAIQSANYGFSILSEEERELTADFLMSKPISRKEIYFAKFFASFLSLLITTLIVSISSFIALELFNNGESYNKINVIILLSTIPIFQLFFLGIGMFISVIVSKIRSVTSYSLGISIGFYVINSISGILSSDILGYMTPFYYFEPVYILKNGQYNLSLLVIALIVITISYIASYNLYIKRDIHSL